VKETQMKNTLLLLVSLAPTAWGLAITDGPYISNITRSSAVFVWVTDAYASGEVHFGYTPEALSIIQGQDGNAIIHKATVSGLKAGSLVYYQVCSGGTCSATAEFQTLTASSNAPLDPIPPTPVDTPDESTGTIWTVGADCYDPDTGLLAQYTRAAMGDVVEIDPALTKNCGMNAERIILPAKAAAGNKVITIRSKGFSGKRRANLKDRASMVRFTLNNNVPATGSEIRAASPAIGASNGTDPRGCAAGSVMWLIHQNTWAMYRCNNTLPVPITGYSVENGNIRLTVPGHGIVTEHTKVFLSGIQPATLGGSYQAHIVDPDHIELLWTACEWGCTVYRPTAADAAGIRDAVLYTWNQYQLEPVVTGTAVPPPTCTFGQWFYLDNQFAAQTTDIDPSGEYHRVWYCDATNVSIHSLAGDSNDNTVGEWVPLSYNADHPVGAGLDFVSNAVSHVALQGFSFEPMHWKADRQLAQLTAAPGGAQGGSVFGQFLHFGTLNHHIYLDGLLMGCPDPGWNAAEIMRCKTAILTDGYQIRIRNSYFYGWQWFSTAAEVSDQNSIVINSHAGGPLELTNNYIDGFGISVYFDEDWDDSARIEDVKASRNAFVRSDKYYAPLAAHGVNPARPNPQWIGGTPMAGDGFWWTDRHAFEFKAIHRGEISDNTFTGGFAFINNGAAICQCPRGNAVGLQVESLRDDPAANETTVQIFAETHAAAEWMGQDYQAGDKVAFSYLESDAAACPREDLQKLYTVTRVNSASNITISPSMGCSVPNAAVSFIVRLTGDSLSTRDILIQNNAIIDSPTGIAGQGKDNYGGVNTGGLPGGITQRVKIADNLFLGIDAMREGLNGTWYGVDGEAMSGGKNISIAGGGEDFQIVHNTGLGRTHQNGLVLSGVGQFSGLTIRDNIDEHLVSNDDYDLYIMNAAIPNTFGKAALDTATVAPGGSFPAYTWDGNMILRPGGAYLGQQFTGRGSYPSGTIWYDTDAGPFPILKIIEGLHLR
jgi:hypothetical protein